MAKTLFWVYIVKFVNIFKPFLRVLFNLLPKNTIEVNTIILHKTRKYYEKDIHIHKNV